MKAWLRNEALTHRLAANAFAVIALVFSPGTLLAEGLYATTGSDVARFDSASLGTIASVSVTGLQPGETLVGIDVRPASGQLYGVGSTSRLYKLNPATGAATQVGSADSFTINGTAFAIDFDPVADRLRLVSNTRQNLRLNPDTGALEATDPSLTPTSVAISAAAYTNSFAGATQTTLYVIDAASGQLATQGSVNGTPNSPNGGMISNVGALGVGANLDPRIGFDISSSTSNAFATILVGGVERLYSINLNTGAATLLGTVGTGNQVYRGVAVAPLPNTLVVTNTADPGDGACNASGIGDGCTLREAVESANVDPSLTTITFAPGLTGVITLTQGELSITAETVINGPGARRLAVSGNGTSRVFSINRGPCTIGGLTIRDGAVIGGFGGGAAEGGGIYCKGTVTLNDCTLSGNQARGGGGGIGGNGGIGSGGAIFNEGTLTLNRCTLSGNNATGGSGGNAHAGGAAQGGAIFNDGILKLTNCTLANNTGTGGGGGTGMAGGSSGGNGGAGSGGIYSVGAFNLNACTLSGNTGAGGAGGKFGGVRGKGSGGAANPGNATVRNTLIAGNTGDSGSVDADGSFNSQGHNLIGKRDGSSGFTAAGDQTGSEAAPLDPRISPLANNTGPTDTMALLGDSPAINGGDDTSAPLQDQRGFARSGTSDIGAFEFTGLPPSSLGNISTRVRIQGGDNVLIAGMIATGNAAKRVIICALGPTLSDLGVPGALTDPTLELFQNSASIATNDDWGSSTQQAEIASSGFAPGKAAEPAIIATLAPNQNYTAVVRGKNGETGIGLVQVSDLDSAADSKLANISTRGFVDVDDNVMIAGLIVGPGNGSTIKVLVRTLGPTLGDLGVAGALANPTLDLVNSSGTVIRSNDNWKDSQRAEIEATPLHPNHDEESALIETLGPGNYTAIVRGSGRTTGVGLVEVYNIQ